MSQIMRDFWPNDLSAATPILTPVAILKEQAALLSQKTKGLVMGEVVSRPQMGRKVNLVHILRLITPALGNYQYELLRVVHPANLYPLTIHYTPSDKTIEAKNEEELVRDLRDLLSRKETLSIIQALVAQAQA